MTSKGHHKHPALKRPRQGNYHHSEWAIYGSHCGAIEQFVQRLHTELRPAVRMAYIDADHGEPISDSRSQLREMIIHQDGTDPDNHYDLRAQLSAVDLVLVNGNHRPASRQVVLLDEHKKDSLHRRLDQLDRLDLIIKKDPDQPIFDFLQTKMDEDTEVLSKGQEEEIRDFFWARVQAAIPEVKALILAGGESQRMGHDKSQITYHELPQELHLAGICRELGLETYLSKGSEFAPDEVGGIAVIKDRLRGMGPMGAIITAFMQDPDTAWLVLACDLPFIDTQAIEHLLTQRNPSQVATSYKSADKDFPEPLITLYEPRAYPRLLQFLSQGYSCPRKVLINSQVHILALQDDRVLENVNTPEQLQQAQTELEKTKGVMDREGNRVSFEDIPAMTIHALRSTQEDYRIISLLEEAEHVAISPDTEHIPYSEFYWNDWEDDGRPTVFYCTTGLRSAEVAYDLMQDFPEATFVYLQSALDEILSALKADPTPSASH